MDIPWRKVKSHVNVILCTRLRDLCQDISFAVLIYHGIICCCVYIVICVVACPDTKSVMMLCRYDKFVESGIFNGAYQCICIKILCQRKYLIWCAVSIMLAPLNLVECVWTKVTKRCQLFLLIIILVFIRQYVIRRGLCCGIILEFAVSDPLVCRLNRNTCSGKRGHSHCRRHKECQTSCCFSLHAFTPS